ncbi:MAG: endo alpha-1,4 polygalactosaminidase [Bacteroidales bacterium]|nr:endo alpha-1,4 polygalactosaminidase [Bacteroidales bacterium]
MKKALFLLILSFSVVSCSKNDYPDLDFKQEMRDFVTEISDYSRLSDPAFIVIPQNGIELVTINGEENGSLSESYLAAINGHGQEDLFYGYNDDDRATPSDENSYMRTFLNMSKNAGKTILVTDYCYTQSKMSDSYNRNNSYGYISFAANHRELDNIPAFPSPIYGENNSVINSLSQVKNFLYLINPENFSSKTDFINAVTSTNYDLLIMDLFFDETTEFTSGEITRLKDKANGGKRLVISYMSIGEAENYRYYWQSGWESGDPFWLDDENRAWKGNYKVRYWEPEWKKIIFGNGDSYTKKIINAGFDGAYLDIIEAFEYFE